MIGLRNEVDRYGLVAIVLHWLTAAAVVGLFALGLWMVELTYYDPWYNRGPWWHKSIGITLFAVVAARLVWRLTTRQPRRLVELGHFEHLAAATAHGLLYLLLLAVMASGYLR